MYLGLRIVTVSRTGPWISCIMCTEIPVSYRCFLQVWYTTNFKIQHIKALTILFFFQKLGQVTISWNSLFNHSVLLYGKVSEVKRVFFLLEKVDFFFPPSTGDKLLILERNQLQGEDWKCHQKTVWWKRLCSYTTDKSSTGQSGHVHGNSSEIILICQHTVPS